MVVTDLPVRPFPLILLHGFSLREVCGLGISPWGCTHIGMALLLFMGPGPTEVDIVLEPSCTNLTNHFDLMWSVCVCVRQRERETEGERDRDRAYMRRAGEEWCESDGQGKRLHWIESNQKIKQTTSHFVSSSWKMCALNDDDGDGGVVAVAIVCISSCCCC